MRLHPSRESHFPLLFQCGYEVTSPETIDWSRPRHNCIAFAADDTSQWWWPDPNGIDYWPPGIPREVTQSAFIEAYGTLGYKVCGGGGLEKGYEKIAIYEMNGEPTHAAKQQSDGTWKSKLGKWEDVRHNTVEAVHSHGGVGYYGQVSIYMRRKNLCTTQPAQKTFLSRILELLRKP